MNHRWHILKEGQFFRLNKVYCDDPEFTHEQNARLEKCPNGAELKQEMIKCGKKNCSRCPHGPYWYVSWYEYETKRTETRTRKRRRFVRRCIGRVRSSETKILLQAANNA